MNKILLSAILVFCFSFFAAAQDSSTYLKKANEFLNKGDIRGAITVLDKAVEKNQNSFEVYRMRSSLHQMLGSFKQAYEDISKAIEMKSTEGELYELRSRMRIFLRHDQALVLEDLDSAIANGWKIEKVYSLRAMFRQIGGDPDGALLDYQIAVGLNPESAASTVGLAGVYEFKGEDAQAISVLENFLTKYESGFEKKPKVKGEVVAKNDVVLMRDDDRNLIVGMSSVVIFKDNDPGFGPPSASELRKQGDKLEQAKNTAHAYATLATLYEKRGEYEKALVTVEKSIKMDRTDFHAVGVRGKIRSSMQDYAGALEDLNAAIRSTPTFPNYYLDRGIVYILMNQDEMAEKDFDAFLKIITSPVAKLSLEKKIAEAKEKRIRVN
jgi:tetratricopeptide (TPR) repeat protein